MSWLGEQTYTVRRSPPVIYVDGIAQHAPGAEESTFEVVGVLRPLSFRSAEALPEGLRQRARWTFYLAPPEALRIFDVAAQTIPDVLVVNGEALHFFAIADNREALDASDLNHSKYLLVLPGAPAR